MTSDQCERSERIRLRRMRVAEEQRQAEFVANAMPSRSEIRCDSKTEAVRLARRMFAGWHYDGHSLLVDPGGRKTYIRTVVNRDRRLLVWGPVGQLEPVLLWASYEHSRRGWKRAPDELRQLLWESRMRSSGLGTTNGRGSREALVPEYQRPAAVPRVG